MRNPSDITLRPPIHLGFRCPGLRCGHVVGLFGASCSEVLSFENLQIVTSSLCLFFWCIVSLGKNCKSVTHYQPMSATKNSSQSALRSTQPGKSMLPFRCGLSRQHTMLGLGEFVVNFASRECETARADVRELSASKVPACRACRMSWVAVPEAKRRPGPNRGKNAADDGFRI